MRNIFSYFRSGQALITFVVMLIFVILPLFAIAFDIANLNYTKQKQKWATDSAALAGAKALSELTTEELEDTALVYATAHAAVVDIAQRNGMNNTSIRTYISNTQEIPHITTQVDQTYVHFMGALLKVAPTTLRTESVAQLELTPNIVIVLIK